MYFWILISDKNRSRAIFFTRGFSLEDSIRRVIIVGQLIEKQIIMMISKAMIIYIGITFETSGLTHACIYYYYSTHHPLSSMHLEY